MPRSDRERAAHVAQLIVDEFRAHGFVPPELVREIQANHVRSTGEVISAEQVEVEARKWAERICAQVDGDRRVEHGDDSVDRAVDTLMTCTPTGKPQAWAESVAVVEQAWKAGRLSPSQIAELDALNTVMAAKVGM